MKKIYTIIGRFQCSHLTQGHQSLIEYASKNSDTLLFFIGISPVPFTKNNPLSFETRKDMLVKYLNSRKIKYEAILPLSNHPSDIEWSNELDKRIDILFEPQYYNVKLICSRDGFKNRYSGKYEVDVFKPIISDSATANREKCKNIEINHFVQREAIIHALQNQYDSVFACIDCAIIKDNKELLIGKKTYDNGYRFIGGFVDPSDKSLEMTVKREVKEEVDIEIDNISYISSMLIDDWRYRYEKDKIITTFFKADYIYGNYQPKDDINEIFLIEINKLKKEDFVKQHQPLFENLINYLNKIK